MPKGLPALLACCDQIRQGVFIGPYCMVNFLNLVNAHKKSLIIN